jgi:hypothetical protein
VVNTSRQENRVTKIVSIKRRSTKSLWILAFVGLAACSQSKKEHEGTQPARVPNLPASPAPAPGAAAAPSASPAGTAVAEANAPAGRATMPAPAACATQTAVACDAGLVDGCTGGLTSVHVCVAADAKAGAPCAQGAALTCPTGQVDACTYAPPYASTHVCVVVPKAAP